MSLLKKLFGSGPDKTPSGETYNGFFIVPSLKKESNGYRIMARIEKEIDGEAKVHTLVRADTIASFEDATAATIAKAKQVIDEQGDALFG